MRTQHGEDEPKQNPESSLVEEAELRIQGGQRSWNTQAIELKKRKQNKPERDEQRENIRDFLAIFKLNSNQCMCGRQRTHVKEKGEQPLGPIQEWE